jgi:hypothetical protein
MFGNYGVELVSAYFEVQFSSEQFTTSGFLSPW